MIWYLLDLISPLVAPTGAATPDINVNEGAIAAILFIPGQPSEQRIIKLCSIQVIDKPVKNRCIFIIYIY